MAAYTTIDDPSAHFQTLLWTGNGTDNRALTNDANAGNFKPDWVWVKGRNQGEWHNVYDSSRGANKSLYTNSTYQEESLSQTFESFDTNGFTVSYNSAYSSVFTNKNSTTYVGWQWKANGGTTASNSDGTITSTTQVNSDAGFSIITYTGNASNSTVGHGLGVQPSVIINKKRGASASWSVWHSALLGTQLLELNTVGAAATVAAIWNSTVPTSSVFSIGTDGQTNSNNTTYVTYAFAEKQGYSKFGKYVGNGSGTSDGTFDGTFVYTGFKPAWVMVKRSSYSAGDGWEIWDSTRPSRGTIDASNYINNKINAKSTSPESGNVYDAVDFLSNGFKLRTGRAGTNASGSTYIYMAFAENPFVTSTGTPTTAR